MYRLESTKRERNTHKIGNKVGEPRAATSYAAVPFFRTRPDLFKGIVPADPPSGTGTVDHPLHCTRPSRADFDCLLGAPSASFMFSSGFERFQGFSTPPSSARSGRPVEGSTREPRRAAGRSCGRRGQEGSITRVEHARALERTYELDRGPVTPHQPGMISEQAGNRRDKHNCQYCSHDRADRVPSPARFVDLGEGVHDVIDRERDGVKGADDCRGEKDDKGAVVAAADALTGLGSGQLGKSLTRSGEERDKATHVIKERALPRRLHRQRQARRSKVRERTW
jgi:hypothetical protein